LAILKHHVTGAIPNQFQLVVGLGLTHNDIGGHLRVLLVRDAVHGEELERFVVKAIVFAQSVIEFFGIARRAPSETAEVLTAVAKMRATQVMSSLSSYLHLQLT
jgi:hypothetical protein